MRTPALTLLTFLLIAASGSAQAPTHIQATLSTGVKLNKAKVGDKLKADVVADVSLADGTKIPVGSTVLGEVTQVDADSVTVVFKAVHADRKDVPVNITLVSAAQMASGESGVRAPGTNTVITRDYDVGTTPGSVIGLPGVILKADDGPPYATKFQLGNKEKQLPKGVQLMFTVRP